MDLPVKHHLDLGSVSLTAVAAHQTTSAKSSNALTPHVSENGSVKAPVHRQRVKLDFAVKHFLGSESAMQTAASTMVAARRTTSADCRNLDVPFPPSVLPSGSVKTPA